TGRSQSEISKAQNFLQSGQVHLVSPRQIQQKLLSKDTPLYSKWRSLQKITAGHKTKIFGSSALTDTSDDYSSFIYGSGNITEEGTISSKAPVPGGLLEETLEA
ncbi:hypothetical protein LEMLEM_LOCUS11039, partial [Lemmus lemmus]